MSRKYTADEMREMAGQMSYERVVNYYPTVFRIAAMLRQAADDLERERRYEYSVKYVGKQSGILIGRETYVYGSKELAMKASEQYRGEKAVLIRRAVGEWEEVTK